MDEIAELVGRYRDLAEAFKTETVVDMTVREIAVTTAHDISWEFAQAADKLEALAAQLEKAMSIAGDDFHKAYAREARIAELEAQVGRLITALAYYAEYDSDGGTIARVLLTELDYYAALEKPNG